MLEALKRPLPGTQSFSVAALLWFIAAGAAIHYAATFLTWYTFLQSGGCVEL